MAHGWLEHFSNDIEVYSAGTKPAEKVNPFAVQAMDRFDRKNPHALQYKLIVSGGSFVCP